MDVLTVLGRFGNIASREQLVAQGMSGGDLTAAVRRGLVWRVRRGYYSAATADRDGIAAVRVGGRLAGLSSARAFGFWAGFDTRLHIGLPANASRLRTQLPPSQSELRTPDMSTREVVLHWLAKRSESQLCWQGTEFECLLQVAEWADTETAIACIDSARQSRGFTSKTLEELFRDQSAKSRARAILSRPGSGSGVESVVRQRLSKIGVLVEQQVAIPGVGDVDMFIPEARLVIEVDGVAFHSSPEQIENDRRRGAVLASLGHRQIRLSYSRVFGDWSWCESIVRAALS